MADLGVSAMAHRLAAYSAARQEQIARNVANADTPGYRATDLPDFAQSLDQSQSMRATRPGHFGADDHINISPMFRSDEASPNGNNVSLENEMMQAATARQSHDLALSVYSSVRGILSTALGRQR
ncbi:FlgB family protein [Palleronia abyssalis]|uniref:Flagellar basal body rod protein FlgB n=1 Tax=Palleronia abyssalis TaxID=1501240 RepID=A0A2R8BX38_9RHOB|nr:FlgB family protein [Palleronia abyssalis]SPJ24636.1 Flagellar basal body rod protein FlgB [Palleronia abyssalis]